MGVIPNQRKLCSADNTVIINVLGLKRYRVDDRVFKSGITVNVVIIVKPIIFNEHSIHVCEESHIWQEAHFFLGIAVLHSCSLFLGVLK